jgi:hypothetical protein
MPRLMDEIRRRKVGRAAIAYTAVAFVVLQVADVALPPLGTRSDEAEPPALTGELCSRTIRSIIAHGAGAADAPAALGRADAIARLGPRGSASVLRAINFSLARLFEEQGRPMDALRAVRRHEVGCIWTAIVHS